MSPSAPLPPSPLPRETAASGQRELLQSLRQQIQHCEANHHQESMAVYSSGCPQLDAGLPGGGFRPATLVEWLSGHPGNGALLWALLAARHAVSKMASADQAAPQRSLLVIDSEQTFYPPAAAALGIDLQRFIVVQPRQASDALWAIDQGLRSPAVAAVVAILDRLSPRDGRRLQLAAEEGGSSGLFLRPLTAQGKPSWSEVQILVQPQLATEQGDRRWRLTVQRCRGSQPGFSVCAPLPTIPQTSAQHETSPLHETHPLPMATPLARPAVGRRAARA